MKIFPKISALFKSIFSLIKATLITALLICAVFFLVNNRNFVLVSFKPLIPEPIETRVFVLIIIGYIAGVCTAILVSSLGFLKKVFLSIKKRRKIS